MDEPTDKGPARYPNGQFGPGNPGRLRGSHNKMSRRIALGLLNHYADNEAELLNRLSQHHFAIYMRLVGRMLPQGPGDETKDDDVFAPEDAERLKNDVRTVIEHANERDRIELRRWMRDLGCGEEDPDAADDGDSAVDDTGGDASPATVVSGESTADDKQGARGRPPGKAVW